MSPNVGNFVHDLVEMAKAMEALPGLQARIDELVKINADLHSDLVKREETILAKNAEILDTTRQLRDAEVARDNASFRLLELEDSFNKVFSQAGALLASANAVKEIISPTPPKVEEPVVITEAPKPNDIQPIHQEASPVAQPDPQSAPSPDVTTPPAPSGGDASPAATFEGQPEGQSVGYPSASSTDSPQASVSSTPAEAVQPASGTDDDIEPMKYEHGDQPTMTNIRDVWWNWHDRQVNLGTRSRLDY